VNVNDGKTVTVTSANFTTSDIHGDFNSAASCRNPNNLLKLESPELAKLFAQELHCGVTGPEGNRTASLA
jgi:hypothetical protein